MFSIVVLTLILACSGLTRSQTNWWSLGVTDCAVSGSCDSVCGQLESNQILTHNQGQICNNDPEAVRAVAKGARQATIECHSRFQNRKWTCSALSGRTENLFGEFVSKQRTRETAVLFAFLVAGATQKLAQFCQEGRIKECTCSETSQHKDEENNIIFEKCGENATWASEYIKRFTVQSYNDSHMNDTETKIDQHNINVGTLVVSRPERFCKCHGISGSCTVQTCYDKVPAVNEVSETLYSKYDGAVQVDLVDGQLQRTGNFNPQADPLKQSDLAFLDKSPDLCVNATEKGVQGTAHRYCDPSPNSPNSCSVLCCGRGHYSVTETKVDKDCVFIYCCRFQCTETENRVRRHRCNP